MPSDPPTICEERLRLLREYSDAATGYSASVREMAAFVNTGEEVRANEARRIAERLGMMPSGPAWRCTGMRRIMVARDPRMYVIFTRPRLVKAT